MLSVKGPKRRWLHAARTDDDVGHIADKDGVPRVDGVPQEELEYWRKAEVISIREGLVKAIAVGELEEEGEDEIGVVVGLTFEDLVEGVAVAEGLEQPVPRLDLLPLLRPEPDLDLTAGAEVLGGLARRVVIFGLLRLGAGVYRPRRARHAGDSVLEGARGEGGGVLCAGSGCLSRGGLLSDRDAAFDGADDEVRVRGLGVIRAKAPGFSDRWKRTETARVVICPP
jgi:hypothetical protein